MIHHLNILAVTAITEAERQEANQRLLWAGLLLVAVLLIGAAILAWLDRWRKQMTDGPATGVDQINSFRLSYERGELSEDEYRRIQQRMTGKPKATPPEPAPSEPKSTTEPPAANP
jgi:hypothetical protein